MGEKIPLRSDPKRMHSVFRRHFELNDSHILRANDSRLIGGKYDESGLQNFAKLVRHELGSGSERTINVNASIFVNISGRETAVMHAIGKMKEPRLAILVAKFLNHHEYSVRHEAANALQKFAELKGSAKPAVLPVASELRLRKPPEDSAGLYRHIQKAAAISTFLGKLGPHASEALPALRAYRKSSFVAEHRDPRMQTLRKLIDKSIICIEGKG